MENNRARGGFIGTAASSVIAILQSTHPEWFGHHLWILPASLILLFISVLFWITQFSWVQRILGLSTRANSAEIERAIEGVLSRKGIEPSSSTAESAVHLKPSPLGVTTAKFDGEVYRIVTAPKGAFAGMTGQLMEMWGQKFAIDIDVLVEMYLVNVSPETQYIKDFRASVEIDGKRTDLDRKNDFYAWEVDGVDYEYCLDPKPKESAFLLESRAETLVAAFPSMPIELAPRQPLRGWVHFLLSETDPKKLENNQTYSFRLTDSFGQEYSITRAARLQTESRVSARKMTVAKK